MTAVQSQPRLLEFHDASVTSVTVGHDATVEIAFDGLNAFFPTSTPEAFEVWRCTCVLVCSDVTGLAVEPPGLPRGAVSDGQLMFDGSNLALHTALVPTRTSELRMQYASGCRLAVSARSVVIKDFRAVRFVENWSGPLDGTATRE